MKEFRRAVTKISHQYLSHGAIGTAINNHPPEITTEGWMHIATPVRAQRFVITIVPRSQIYLTKELRLIVPSIKEWHLHLTNALHAACEYQRVVEVLPPFLLPYLVAYLQKTTAPSNKHQ